MVSSCVKHKYLLYLYAFVVNVCYNNYMKQKRREGEQVSAIDQFKIAHFSKKKNKMVNEKADEIWVCSTTTYLELIFEAIMPKNLKYNSLLYKMNYKVRQLLLHVHR